MTTLYHKTERKLVDSFSRVSSAVNLSVVRLGDDHLSSLILEEISLLLVDLIYYLKDTTQTRLGSLNLRANSLIRTMEILYHSNKIHELDYLTIETAILTFIKLILDHKRAHFITASSPKLKTKAVDNFTSRFFLNTKGETLNPVKKELLEFITTRKEVLNIDIFNRMSNLTKRSVKRHLSELINNGYVYRQSQGKRVFYGIKEGNE